MKKVQKNKSLEKKLRIRQMLKNPLLREMIKVYQKKTNNCIALLYKKVQKEKVQD